MTTWISLDDARTRAGDRSIEEALCGGEIRTASEFVGRLHSPPPMPDWESGCAMADAPILVDQASLDSWLASPPRPRPARRQAAGLSLEASLGPGGGRVKIGDQTITLAPGQSLSISMDTSRRGKGKSRNEKRR